MSCIVSFCLRFFLFKPKTAYEMRISDWSSDVCSADLARLWRALTPQLFRRLQLARALEAARAAGIEITDESMAMERQGHRPLLVEGADDDFKVTTPADMARLAFIVSQRTEKSTWARPSIARNWEVAHRWDPPANKNKNNPT